MADYMREVRLELVWARNMDKPCDFRFGPVSNPFFVVWLVLEGRRRVEIGGRLSDIGPGDTVVFPPNAKYQLFSEEEPGRSVHYFSMGCGMTVGAFDLSELFVIPTVISGVPSEYLQGLRSQWEDVHRAHERLGAPPSTTRTAADRGIDALIVQASVQASLYRWFALFLQVVRPQPIASSPLTDERILQTCLLIQRNLYQPLTLEGLSRQVFLSPGHLSYLFKQALNLSPMAYVRKQRMKQAKQMLLDTSLSIREIGSRIGYEDQGQFSRLFRSAEGCSPLQYRQRWKPY